MRTRALMAVALALLAAACAGYAPAPMVEGDIRILDRLGGGAMHLAWSPDGRYLAADRGSGGFAVWDAQSGRKVRELRQDSWGRLGGQSDLAFTPDSKHVIVKASFSPTLYRDGRRIEFGVWNVESGTIAATLVGPIGRPEKVGANAHAMGAEHLAVHYVTTEGALPTISVHEEVVLYDTRTWQQAHVFPVARGTSGLAFDPSGRLLAASVGDSVSIYEAASGRLVTTLARVTVGTVHHFAYLAGDRVAATANWMWTPTTDLRGVRVLDAAGGASLQSFARGSEVAYSLSRSADGRFLALAGGSVYAYSFKLWDTEAAREVGWLHGEGVAFHASALSPDGRRAAVSYGRTRRDTSEILVIAVGADAAK